ncbi:hypothetical protein V6Z05_19655 [Leptospira venezuelensis]|nr:hypothetical protein [Leptospira venezuelensis]
MFEHRAIDVYIEGGPTIDKIKSIDPGWWDKNNYTPVKEIDGVKVD